MAKVESLIFSSEPYFAAIVHSQKVMELENRNIAPKIKLYLSKPVSNTGINEKKKIKLDKIIK